MAEAAQDLTTSFLNGLVDDINKNRISLPTLPEVALKVRETVENPDASANSVSKVLASDAALTAKVLQIANGPLHRGNREIENIQQAVTRLGNVMVRNVVTTLVMQQLYQASTLGQTRELLTELWYHSTRVAAISSILAKRCTRLQADEALLAGLIHDIGSIPIIMRAEMVPELFNNREELLTIVTKLHNRIGMEILMRWNFSKEMVDMVAHHDDIYQSTDGDASLRDVVTVANITSRHDEQHPYAEVDWSEVPALKKLGLTPDDRDAILEEAKKEISDLQAMLSS